ncbi:DUF983 domain-containing protein [Larkinella insperata]|uniref:DUF983 domain-containing protein n=2 Tax=Larkinella insperata TaxID=332158 RepID=A0ABW3QC16_9BACT
MANVSKSQAVSAGLCPRCRQGKIFKYSLYNIRRFDEMYEHCPNCGLRYEIEPGYFWGAMFVSYALSGGVALVAGFLIFYALNDPDGWTYVLIICPLLVLITPVNFRLSRVLWLHYVSGISYDPEKRTEF